MRINSVFSIILALATVACSEPKETTGESDQIETITAVYSEPHRPQYHFSPPEQWTNDPNGMVYYEGEYHLFYQHYPDSNVWGPMHWAHAVSEDLVHWENLPIAIYPDELGYIFSGSAVVDWNNTSGFGSEGNPPLVAIYTYHEPEGRKAGEIDYQTQAIAYSNDKGRNWTKYDGNPVLGNPGIEDFRDPKVFWHEPTGRWVMVLAVKDHISLYTSPNLIDWAFASDFGIGHKTEGVWECPDLFELPVDDGVESKWVLILNLNPGHINGGSGTQYFVGEFDGTTFTNDNSLELDLWMDYGRDNYAGVTWSDVPEADGRRILIGWMSNWSYANLVPTEAWRNAMTVPRILGLTQTADGIRLTNLPVKEMQGLRQKEKTMTQQRIQKEMDITQELPFSVTTSELVLEFGDWTESANFGIRLSNSAGEEILVGFDASSQQYYVDRSQPGKVAFSADFAGKHTAPRMLDDATIRMHILVDASSVEIFADNGLVVLTEVFFPNEDFDQLALYAINGEVDLKSGSAYGLGSIWQ